MPMFLGLSEKTEDPCSGPDRPKCRCSCVGDMLLCLTATLWDDNSLAVTLYIFAAVMQRSWFQLESNGRRIHGQLMGVACDKRIVDYPRRMYGEPEHRWSDYVLRHHQEDSNIWTVSDRLP
jgi:hypothetical protein